jgi:hypothetical protein
MHSGITPEYISGMVTPETEQERRAHRRSVILRLYEVSCIKEPLRILNLPQQQVKQRGAVFRRQLVTLN